MGAGASATQGLSVGLQTATDADVKATLQQLSSEDRRKLRQAMEGYDGAREATAAPAASEQASVAAAAPQGSAPSVEAGTAEGSHVVARLKGAGDANYVYARVESMQPLSIRGCFGETYTADQLIWVALAKDDGWLQPLGLEWQKPGRLVMLKMLGTDEWISAKVDEKQVEAAIRGDTIVLQLAGVDGLTSVKVQEEVALLFTPHNNCQDEFAGGTGAFRGGKLMEHMARAFEGKLTEEEKGKQRERWVLASRIDGQYPVRCVWCHPQVKQKGLAEFVRRCHAKRNNSEKVPAPEIVMLLGPPAAGKSSISRLPPGQVPVALRDTAASLQFREEVNNDNLTDCMPGFAEEYKQALELPSISSCSVKDGSTTKAKLAKAHTHSKTIDDLELIHESWAICWLVYLLYHHGPVRDSLAWDVITTTVIDAAELPVYYSSVMAGKSIGRTMQILELAHSDSAPVPHTPLRFVGFWPYASQEARYSRQKHRADAEKAEGKLKGGNLDSNLVDLHYHAQQAESNITNMLACLHRGVRATDDPSAAASEQATEITSDHFLIVDNDGQVPKILLDFGDDDHEANMNVAKAAAQVCLQHANGFDEWFSLCQNLYIAARYFLPEDDELVKAAAGKAKAIEKVPDEPEDVLPIITEVDEEVFMRLNKDATATESDDYRAGVSKDLSPRGMQRLMSMSDEVAKSLKQNLAVMRKYCVVSLMQDIRDEDVHSDDEDI